MRRELERAQPRKAHRAPPTLSGRPLELIAFARTVWSRSSRSRITTNSAYASYPRGKPPKARPLTLRLYHRAWAPQRMPRTARQNDRNPLQERVSVCQSRSGRWDSNPRPSAWEADALPTELHPRAVDSTREGRGIRAPREACSCGSRGSLVDLDEAEIIVRDLVDGGVAFEAVRVGGVGLHRLAEDRAADCEADVSLDS
jgi:hypothetical protein